MHFKVCHVNLYMSPQDLNADDILSRYGVSVRDLDDVVKSAEFVHSKKSRGFQVELARQLEELFKKLPWSRGVYVTNKARYTPAMRETPDVAIGWQNCERKIFIEIEFRPNEHKDLVKFLIAHRHQQLDLGILVVAIDRKEINENYYTMPQYDKCLRTIEELRDECPILLMGIGGKWLGSASASSKKHLSFRVDDRNGMSV